MALVCIGAGCAPSLSTFQPANVAPQGHVSVSMGIEGNVPAGAFTTLVDAGKGLARQGQRGRVLTDGEKWTIFDAGVNLLLASPSIGPHVAAAYVPVEHLEVGLRYAGSAWRVGARYQLVDHARGPFDLTVGLGLSRFSWSVPLSDEIPGLSLDGFSRWQLDVPVLVGTSRDWFRVWAGPKLLLTTFATELTLALPGDATFARFDGTAAFLGGQGGFAVGYRKLFVAFELTLAEAFGSAHLSAPALAPPTHDTTLSAFTIFPSVGLMGEF